MSAAFFGRSGAGPGALSLPPDAVLEQWRAQRDLLARLSVAHQFFWDMDLEAFPPLLDHRAEEGELTPEFAARRKAAVGAASWALLERVMLRVRKPGGPIPPPSGDAADAVRECSHLLHGLALRLATSRSMRPEWALVGEAFLLFGSGDLRGRTFVEMGGKPDAWDVAEPDSANVLLFAELALASMDLRLHEAMWSALLPYLVRTQWYYWARVAKPGAPPAPLRCYRLAGPLLTAVEHWEIDRRIPLSLPRGDLERLIAEKLAERVVP